MIEFANLDQGQLSTCAIAELNAAILILIEQRIPVTSETIATWCAERLELYAHNRPMRRRTDAPTTIAALGEIRRALGISGVTIAIVPIEVDGARGVVAEIRDAATCAHLDSSGRKRLGDVLGKSADVRALDEAAVICRVRGWKPACAATTPHCGDDACTVHAWPND